MDHRPVLQAALSDLSLGVIAGRSRRRGDFASEPSLDETGGECPHLIPLHVSLTDVWV